MTTSYCLSYEYLDYSHREEIATSTDKEDILAQYKSFVQSCKDEDDYDGVDYVSVEEVDVETDEYGDVIAETTFVEPGE